MATVTEVRELLAETALPEPLVDMLLSGASDVWLSGESPLAIASDLALLHPPLGANEVRALALPTASGGFRISVAVHDRRGLLAGTAAVCAGHGLSITSAAASTWPELGLALQRVDVTPEGDAPNWDAVGAELRHVLSDGHTMEMVFKFGDPVEVTAVAADRDRTLVSVTAPDKLGLLAMIANWFAHAGCNIEVAHVRSEGGLARDIFLVEGRPDPEALRNSLRG